MRWPALAMTVLGAACGEPTVDPREVEVASVIARADEVLLRARPKLMAGRYARMAGGAFDFYRGNLALFRHDWELGRVGRSAFVAGEPPVWGLGDPHPENFGILVGADGVAALEPNDFDSADRVPYLFDLRRLVGGLGLAVRVAGAAVPPSALGEAAARSYARTLAALHRGEPRVRLVGPGEGPVTADLFRRSGRDQAARAELMGLTDAAPSSRRFRRGAPDLDEPTHVLADVAPEVGAEVAVLLRRLDEGLLLDVVREFGTGVASWPRVRLLALLDGPTTDVADDVVVEVKELPESMLAGWYAPWLPSTDSPSRVESAARRAWFVPDADPRFFATTWLGLPVLVRTESEAFKSVRVDRLTGDRGTPAALTALAEQLGAVLARVHARSEEATVAAIVVQLERDPEAFAVEQGAFAEAHSAEVLRDAAFFSSALRRLGPALGLRHDVREAPSGAAAQLFEAGVP